MITEIRQSRTRLLEHNERRSRRRHHTLDNATLDKFNFICIPLRCNEKRSEVSSSQSNLTVITSKDYSISKPIDVSSPSRRVRFKFDENDKNRSHFQQHIHSSDDVRLPKKHKIHRVEFQIPIPTAVNPWLNVARSSTPAKTRSITSQKIDINHNTNNLMYPPSMTSFIDSLPPTVDNSDKTRTQWYKEMYCQIHKSSGAKKDTILVKVPHTPSRYREYYQRRDEPPNPYKPTYTFPDKFDGDLEHMEDYIRKTASQNIDETVSSSAPPVRIPIRNFNDSQMIPKRSSEKVIRFSDQLTSVITTPERVKSSNETSSSPKTIQSRSNPDRPIRTSSSPTTTTSDDEQKSIYKHVLHGGDIPSAGFQRHLINNRVSSSSIPCPLSLRNHSQSSRKLFAYYSVHWEQNQTNHLNDLIDNDGQFEINSCLYFQNKNDDNDDDDEWEDTREDGCGYVIFYPPHIHPTDNLQIYNFDRKKNFLLTSNDIYSHSKNEKEKNEFSSMKD